tara:strand:- start:3484 stop:4770 length:1287 start_codon:yes stop_codon:yes gene_type:complete
MNNQSEDYKKIDNFISAIQNELKKSFEIRNQKLHLKIEKILRIFQEEKVSAIHFQSSTGIGYNDLSREKIDKVFARFFYSQKAAIRMQFVSGTHAISSVLFGVLRPGDMMLCVTGNPYDTLEEVIGIRGNGSGSLKDFGVEYKQIDIIGNKNYEEKILDTLRNNNCKLVFIQKSCGYTWRKSLTNKDIEEVCNLVHSTNPNCVCFVDNCYGELVEDSEPIENGADIVAGSLIKNLGGTIVPTGGYVAGNENLVELACSRLTSPGIGINAGINFGLGRLILQGLFLAPQMVNEALNSADLIAAVFQKMGCDVLPHPGSYRSDIIQAVQLKDPRLIKTICQSFQRSSPIDSFLNVIPSEMSGYDSNLIMSGGTFIEGSTSEFSADSPLREPYNIFIQGGSHISHVKIALIQLLSDLLDENLINREFLLFN